MPIEIMRRYTREVIRANPHKLFVFGDNHCRKGMGGQAKEARGEPNAVGIRTKLAPTYNPEDMMYDKDYIQNVDMIMEDFRKVFVALLGGEIVVWPLDGIGTGLAKLSQNAPRTLSFIDNLIYDLMNIYGLLKDGEITYGPEVIRVFGEK